MAPEVRSHPLFRFPFVQGPGPRVPAVRPGARKPRQLLRGIVGLRRPDHHADGPGADHAGQHELAPARQGRMAEEGRPHRRDGDPRLPQDRAGLGPGGAGRTDRARLPRGRRLLCHGPARPPRHPDGGARHVRPLEGARARQEAPPGQPLDPRAGRGRSRQSAGSSAARSRSASASSAACRIR